MLKDLIENWAPDSIASTFVIADRSLPIPSTGLGFVAALYSGKSQLAFRAICSEVFEVGKCAIKIYLFDSESELPEYLFEHKEAIESGNGLLLRFDDDEVSRMGSGADIKELELNVRNYFDAAG